jgi:hypothetical protein
VQRVPLVPDRPVAEVTRDVLAAVARAGGTVRINPVPQEVPWSVPLDQDYEHARYDPDQVEEYFAAATQAALALAAFRAPYQGRSTPVNAWWGSFDLCVVMFSGAPVDPPSDDFITRNASDAQQVVVGWCLGTPEAGPPSTPTPIRRRPASPAPCPRRPSAGTRLWGQHPGLGRRPRRPARRSRGLSPLGLSLCLPHTRTRLSSGDRHLALAVDGVPNWPICIVAAVGVST